MKKTKKYFWLSLLAAALLYGSAMLWPWLVNGWILPEGAAMAAESDYFGTIKLSLIDKDAGRYVGRHGDASQQGAVYGLYSDQNGLIYDGQMIGKGQLVTQVEMVDGKAVLEYLPAGNYYVQAITPSEGYVLSSDRYQVTISEKEKQQAIEVAERVIVGCFQIIKIAEEKSGDFEYVENTGLSIYLVSDLIRFAEERQIDFQFYKYSGGYQEGYHADCLKEFFDRLPEWGAAVSDLPRAVTYRQDESGLVSVGNGLYQLDELRTNVYGSMVTPLLPYGEYVIAETATPAGYGGAAPLPATVHTDSIKYVKKMLTEEKPVSACLKIVKRDQHTQKAILAPGITYEIYRVDEHAGSIAENKLQINGRDQFVTDQSGMIITEEPLIAGIYRIYETEAPKGYCNIKGYIEVSVDEEYIIQADVDGQSVQMIEVFYDNPRSFGLLKIQKYGEALASHDKTSGFIYEQSPLEGVQFEIYAAETIRFDEDYDIAGKESETIQISENELVAVVETDDRGEASRLVYSLAEGTAYDFTIDIVEHEGCKMLQLPLGRYRVIEKSGTYGYLVNEALYDIRLDWKNQYEAYVLHYEADEKEPGIIVHNERIRLYPEILKKDSQTKKAVEGAVFGLFTSDAIYNKKGELIMTAGSLIEQIVTDKDGTGKVTADLPWQDTYNTGCYYIEEMAAPEGYLINHERLSFVWKPDKVLRENVRMQFEYQNQPTEVKIEKRGVITDRAADQIHIADSHTRKSSEVLAGAQLKVIRLQDYETVAKFISEAEGFIIEYLALDTEYMLHEEIAPEGYIKAEDIYFKVMQTVTGYEEHSRHTIWIKDKDSGQWKDTLSNTLIMYDWPEIIEEPELPEEPEESDTPETEPDTADETESETEPEIETTTSESEEPESVPPTGDNPETGDTSPIKTILLITLLSFILSLGTILSIAYFRSIHSSAR